MKWLKTHLPDAEFGVVDDVVGHGKLSLVLRRVDRLDLPDDAAPVLQNAPVLRGDVRQYRHHKWVSGFRLSQPHHALEGVVLSSQECHICPVGKAGSLGQTSCTGEIKTHYFLQPKKTRIFGMKMREN